MTPDQHLRQAQTLIRMAEGAAAVQAAALYREAADHLDEIAEKRRNREPALQGRERSHRGRRVE
jgi:hypothetical protein